MTIYQVNKDNVQQVWHEYETYLKWVKENYYSDFEPMSFNDWIKCLVYSKKQEKWLEDYIVEEEGQCIDLEVI